MFSQGPPILSHLSLLNSHQNGLKISNPSLLSSFGIIKSPELRTTNELSQDQWEALESWMNNIIIQFSCFIVKQLHRRLSIEGLSLPSCPIWGNPSLSAGGRSLSNNIWQLQLDRYIETKPFHFNNLKINMVFHTQPVLGSLTCLDVFVYMTVKRM